MASNKPFPIKLERMSTSTGTHPMVTKGVMGRVDPGLSPPLFRLISPRKMENVSHIARRQLSKMREQRKLEEFLAQQYAGLPRPMRISPATNVIRGPSSVSNSVSMARPRMTQAQVENGALKDVTKRIRSLLHEMRGPNSNEYMDESTGCEVKLKAKSDKPIPTKRQERSGVFPKRAASGSITGSSITQKSTPSWESSSRKPRKCQETLPAKQSQPTNVSRLKDKETLVEAKPPVVPGPRIKLPPYKLRRTTYHRQVRWPRNASALSKPMANIAIPERRSTKAKDDVDPVPVDKAVAESVPEPNDVVQRLWKRLNEIELEDREIERNLQAMRLNRVVLPSSILSTEDQSDSDFDYLQNEVTPNIIEHLTKEQTDIVVSQPAEDRTATNRETSISESVNMPYLPSQAEWNLVNDVSNEVIQHLMDELSSEFKELPQAILKELFEREFISGAIDTTKEHNQLK